MRKRLKRKKKSCAMCKPHKMNGANRWKPKEEQALKEFEASTRKQHEGLEDRGSTDWPIWNQF